MTVREGARMSNCVETYDGSSDLLVCVCMWIDKAHIIYDKVYLGLCWGWHGRRESRLIVSLYHFLSCLFVGRKV